MTKVLFFFICYRFHLPGFIQLWQNNIVISTYTIVKMLTVPMKLYFLRVHWQPYTALIDYTKTSFPQLTLIQTSFKCNKFFMAKSSITPKMFYVPVNYFIFNINHQCDVNPNELQVFQVFMAKLSISSKIIDVPVNYLMDLSITSKFMVHHGANVTAS